ncbi:MAG: c(7)-type cytochrome triheme domain-containing protein [Nitrospiria bacterium]
MRRIGKIVILALLFLPLTASCAPETKRRLLTFFFDGVPAPGQDTAEQEQKQPRPTVVKKPASAVPETGVKLDQQHPEFIEENLPAEHTTRWEDIAPMLPKDVQGEIDWLKAMDMGIIKPRSGLAPATPDLEVFPLELEMATSGLPGFGAHFSHTAHTRLFTCEGCHTGIFEMEQGANAVTMDRIYAGQYCGVCHGTVAFGIDAYCARCHTGMEANPPEEKGRATKAGEIVFERTGAVRDVPPAVFPHWLHRIRYRCNVCHPDLFALKRGATPVSMAAMREGRSCDICHNGKTAWGIGFETCQRCHSAQAPPAPKRDG